MNYRLFSLATLLAAGIPGISANATTPTEYLAERTRYEVTTVQPSDQLAVQMAAKTGKVIEIEGRVGGIVKGDTYSGYLLQLDDRQSGVISADVKGNPNVTIGNDIRVLARVPEKGTVLHEIAGISVSENGEGSSNPVTQRELTKAAAPREAVVKNTDANPVAQTAAVSSIAKRTTTSAKVAAKPAATVNNSQVAMYAKKIRTVNGNVSQATATKIAANVLAKSKKHGVDPKLVFAVLAQESRFESRAVSRAGAQGLGQLMPATARSLGVKDSFNIEQNIDGTVRYLSEMIRKFGNVRTALAAYNAGPGNVQRYGGIPPFRETQHYVKTISSHYQQLKGSIL